MRVTEPRFDMWGSTQTLKVQRAVSAGVPPRFTSPQLLHAHVQKPTTWKIMLGVQLVSIDTVDGDPNAGLRIFFKAYFGLGRSQIIADNFMSVGFATNAIIGGILGQQLWYAASEQDQLDPRSATPGAFVDQYPAQQIQIEAYAFPTNQITGGEYTLNVTAQTAPLYPGWEPLTQVSGEMQR